MRAGALAGERSRGHARRRRGDGRRIAASCGRARRQARDARSRAAATDRAAAAHAGAKRVA
ncbi:hypothetical protein, partial [Burkholderia pseudomallei]|uniref:hypothetical protein n=1 Tax=Burkholderia pseudomallei TaxID=28450 RepID=UPI001C4C05C9